MDSDLEQQQYRHHFQTQQQQQQQQRSNINGLTRYRSAPSSYLSSFMDMTPVTTTTTATAIEVASQPRPLSPETESILARFVQSVADGPVVKQETGVLELHQFSYQPTSNKPPLARRTTNTKKRQLIPTLARHRSSPVSLFDDIIIQNGLLVSTPKVEEEEEVELIKFPAGNWDELSDQFENHHHQQSELQEEESSSSSAGVGRISGAGLGLGHHMSLPTAASLEKLLQIDEQDQAAGLINTGGGCQLRAKRGCATHPRSIAERVRRTKISERMRKLQDLVPNMDNQTNTADMLDLAVDYIKQLETQISTLRNKRARCTCISSISRS